LGIVTKMITKIEYVGFEGETGSHYVVHKTKSISEFEKDLKAIKLNINTRKFPIDFIELAETYYELVCIDLKKLGYLLNYVFINTATYEVDMSQEYEHENGDGCRKVIIEKQTQEVKREQL